MGGYNTKENDALAVLLRSLRLKLDISSTVDHTTYDVSFVGELTLFLTADLGSTCARSALRRVA